MECPCKNCIVFAMCLSKPTIDLVTCKLFMQYVHVDDINQKHSRLTIAGTLFSEHNKSTELINSLILDIEDFMEYQRKRNSNV